MSCLIRRFQAKLLCFLMFVCCLSSAAPLHATEQCLLQPTSSIQCLQPVQTDWSVKLWAAQLDKVPLTPFGWQDGAATYLQLRISNGQQLCGEAVFAGDSTDFDIEQMIACTSNDALLLLTLMLPQESRILPASRYTLARGQSEQPPKRNKRAEPGQFLGMYYGKWPGCAEANEVIGEVISGELFVSNESPLAISAPYPICFELVLGKWRPLRLDSYATTAVLPLPDVPIRGCLPLRAHPG